MKRACPVKCLVVVYRCIEASSTRTLFTQAMLRMRNSSSQQLSWVNFPNLGTELYVFSSPKTLAGLCSSESCGFTMKHTNAASFFLYFFGSINPRITTN